MLPQSPSKPIFLVGGAPITDTDLKFIRSTEPDILVAVDGGANSLPDDLSPDKIIGDLDSYDRKRQWSKQPTILQITDQESTDLEKAISHCINTSSDRPLICLGFIGGRFDQTLTVLHTCLLFSSTRLMFLSNCDLAVTLMEGTTALDLPVDSRLSLYPLSCCQFGASKGLKYPLDNLEMEQGRSIGTSNETNNTHIEISLVSGNCLLIVDRSNISRVLQSVSNV